MKRPHGLFALRAHPLGAALWTFSAAAALCSRLHRSSSASLRTAAAEAATSNPARRRVVEPSCYPSRFDLLVSNLAARAVEELF